jgi:hypothetical protein
MSGIRGEVTERVMRREAQLSSADESAWTLSGDEKICLPYCEELTPASLVNL